MFLIGAENEITQYYIAKHIKTTNTISAEYIFRRDSSDLERPVQRSEKVPYVVLIIMQVNTSKDM